MMTRHPGRDGGHGVKQHDTAAINMILGGVFAGARNHNHTSTKEKMVDETYECWTEKRRGAGPIPHRYRQVQVLKAASASEACRMS